MAVVFTLAGCMIGRKPKPLTIFWPSVERLTIDIESGAAIRPTPIGINTIICQTAHLSVPYSRS